MDNIENCHHCEATVCFEGFKGGPTEYEICEECECHVCDNCFDWKHFADTEENKCKKCTGKTKVCKLN